MATKKHTDRTKIDQPTKELSKFNFKHGKPCSQVEMDARLVKRDIITDNAASIDRWSDWCATTAEGRTFGLFLDGKSIEHRFRAASVLVTANDTARLAKTAGFILEVGAEKPLLVSEDYNALVRAWAELREAHGVPLTPDEVFMFGLEEVSQ